MSTPCVLTGKSWTPAQLVLPRYDLSAGRWVNNMCASVDLTILATGVMVMAGQWTHGAARVGEHGAIVRGVGPRCQRLAMVPLRSAPAAQPSSSDISPSGPQIRPS